MEKEVLDALTNLISKVKKAANAAEKLDDALCGRDEDVEWTDRQMFDCFDD